MHSANRPSHKQNSGKDLHLLEKEICPEAPGEEDLNALISKVAPVLCFYEDEFSEPIAVDFYLQKAWLVNDSRKTRVPAGLASLPLLLKEESTYFLELKEGVSAASFVSKQTTKTYVHVKCTDRGYVDIQYWFFFATTASTFASVKWMIDEIKGHEGKIDLNPLGEINGIWEHVTVRVSNQTQLPVQVFFPQHDNGVWLNADTLEMQGTQPRVYVSQNTCMLYPARGVKQSEKLKFNLFTSQLEFCLHYECGSATELNMAHHCELIAATYKGESFMQEPLWLEFLQHWGAPEPDYLTHSTIKRIVLSTFGKTLEFLLSRNILDDLVQYLLLHFTKQAVQRTLAPKSRKCWMGDETEG